MNFKCESEEFNGPKCKVQCESCKAGSRIIKKGEGQAIKEITFEDLKIRGFQANADGDVRVIYEVEGFLSEHELSKARPAAWEWFTAKFGEGARRLAQNIGSGRIFAGRDAGKTEVQPDTTHGSDGGRLGDGRKPNGPPQARSFATGRVVRINYLNWRGEKRWRRILPHTDTVHFGETEWHPGPQWLFSATDLEDGKMKTFAMNGIFGWDVDPNQTLPWRTPDPIDQPFVKDECHPSHVTRASDASSYDEICVNCGARDIAGGGWGKLKYPCPQVDAEKL
jgi:hypothetical protein